MVTTSHKKRSLIIFHSGDSCLSSMMPPSSVTMSSPENDDEYERAVAFLRKFHSTRVAALSPTSKTPLGAISEVGIGDLVNDFSLALQVESSSKVPEANASCSSASFNRSPRIKRTATSTCLLDLAATSSSNSCSSSSDSSTVEDSRSLHHQARDDILPGSCSTSSEFGVGYNGFDALANKRHCSSRVR